jgi:hypothetical protein
MDRDEAIKLLTGGTEGIAEWNRRRESDETIPNLSEANLSGANLSGARLNGENLSGANLRDANLSVANLRVANLRGADLSGAALGWANLSGAWLNGANLSVANLSVANLSGADLSGADLSAARCGWTLFVNVDLSRATGLDSVRHEGPSTVGIDTLFASDGKVPEWFLHACGVPEELIGYLPYVFRAMQPIQFHSCFISHASADKDFARRLFSRMRDEGLRAWFDEEHVSGARELHPQIDEAIRVHDKLLLILSESSMRSNWVLNEIRRTRLAEKREGRRKLFPVRVIDFERIKEWELPDSSGEDLAEVVRRSFIRDFSNWKDNESFEGAFAHLLRDLKSEESTGASPQEPTPPETPH